VAGTRRGGKPKLRGNVSTRATQSKDRINLTLILRTSADQLPSATTGSTIDPYLRLLTKEELAPFIGKAPRSIDRMVRLRVIPYLKIGRHVRFRLRDVEQALDRFVVKAATEPSKLEVPRA